MNLPIMQIAYYIFVSVLTLKENLLKDKRARAWYRLPNLFIPCSRFLKYHLFFLIILTIRSLI
ncbi:MAG: hypothetical protein QOF02_2245 [Blastocatellia bacterium]|nr:hypothetical protein [Blastocatellia bacterium]